MIKEEWMLPDLLHARAYASCDNTTDYYPERTADFYELSIYTQSTGTLHMNGQTHKIHRGDVRFTRPGDRLRTDIPFRSMTLMFRFGDDNTEYNQNFLNRISSFLRADDETLAMFHNIIELFTSMSTGDKVLMNGYVLMLLHHLFELSENKRTVPEAVAVSLNYIKNHYTEKITLETLGQITGYSALHVLRLFKDYVGQTPCEYLQSLRMFKARELLDNTTLSVFQIMTAVGFTSHSSFQSLFKKTFGITPGKYRKRSETILP